MAMAVHQRGCSNPTDIGSSVKYQVSPQHLELRHERQLVERPHKVPSEECAHLEVIPQHGDAERHQPSPAFLQIFGTLALVAVLALDAACSQSEAIPGEESEEGEHGGGEELGLFVGEKRGVLVQHLEQAGVPGERHAAEEGGEEGREPRRRRAGELGGGEEEAGARVGEEGEWEGEESGREGMVEGGEAGAGGVEDDKETARERGRLGEEGEGEGEG